MFAPLALVCPLPVTQRLRVGLTFWRAPALFTSVTRGDCAEELVTSLEFLLADLKFGRYTVWYLGPVHCFGDSILGSVAGSKWVPDQK
jgi:hypothetical protein